MENKKFYKAVDAAEYATSITNEWKTEDDEIMDTEALIGYMSVADEEDSLDEEDENVYYLVTNVGAVGFTTDAEKLVHWIAIPTKEDNKETKNENKRPGGKIGYSDVINEPRFQEALKKQRKSAKGCARTIIIAPAIICPIYVFFTGEDVIVGLGIGIVISVIFFIIGFLATFKERFENSWEGVVEKKYKKEMVNHRKDQDSLERKEMHEFVIVRDNKGKKHKIEEVAGSFSGRSYAYFKEGDKLCYHGKMGLFYPYEKYDKSKDEYVICAFCRHRTSILDDDCSHCHNPILK